MRRKWFWIAPLAIVAIPLFIFVGGEVVMHLWNWLAPALFGWHTITFWQGLGLLLLLLSSLRPGCLPLWRQPRGVGW